MLKGIKLMSETLAIDIPDAEGCREFGLLWFDEITAVSPLGPEHAHPRPGSKGAMHQNAVDLERTSEPKAARLANGRLRCLPMDVRKRN